MPSGVECLGIGAEWQKIMVSGIAERESGDRGEVAGQNVYYTVSIGMPPASFAGGLLIGLEHATKVKRPRAYTPGQIRPDERSSQHRPRAQSKPEHAGPLPRPYHGTDGVLLTKPRRRLRASTTHQATTPSQKLVWHTVTKKGLWGRGPSLR